MKHERLSITEEVIRERERLVDHCRLIARGLQFTDSDLHVMLQQHTGENRDVFIEFANVATLHKLYDNLADVLKPGNYVVHGEASYDRIRRATPECLKAVIVVGDASGDTYFKLAAGYCRKELEHRGLAE